MIRDYGRLQRQLQRRLKRATDGSGWKEKAAACVQTMDIYLVFKIGHTGNISVESVVKQHSILAVLSSYMFKGAIRRICVFKNEYRVVKIF